MATYAAYRHVELDHVGYGKRRVLKPPGGGSSDIFGTTDQQQSPRKVKQYMASNVILADNVPPSSGPGSTASSTSSSGSAPDTPSPSSPTRNGTTSSPAEPVASDSVLAAGAVGGEPKGRSYQMQSHFVLGYDKSPSPVKGGGSVGSPEEGDVKDGAVREGNPVTGEGYAQQNGQGKSNGSQAPSAPRSRVPPGGYSSGLW